MRAVAMAAWLCCIFSWAQESPVMRGVVIRRDAGGKSGELQLRAADDRVLKFRFDPQTYVERNNRSIEVAQLKAGEQVEVVSEAMPGAVLRTARSIQVLTAALVERHRPQLETPRGDLTFSGLVLRLTDSRLVLHQREAGDLEILLRRDTQFLDNGESVAPENLKPNMRVFVRGGKDVAGKVEAYQVVWGSMLAPK